jgi:hypothetical protein
MVEALRYWESILKEVQISEVVVLRDVASLQFAEAFQTWSRGVSMGPST